MMETITKMVREAVRNGEPLPKIKRRLLCGIINSSMIASYGNQTEAGRQLSVNRWTIRNMVPNSHEPIKTGLKYREAWALIMRTAVAEAIEITGSCRDAVQWLKAAKHTVWTYSK